MLNTLPVCREEPCPSEAPQSTAFVQVPGQWLACYLLCGALHTQAPDSDPFILLTNQNLGVPAPLTRTSPEYSLVPQAFLPPSENLEPYSQLVMSLL